MMLGPKDINDIIHRLNGHVRSPLAMECIRQNEEDGRCEERLQRIRKLASDLNWELHEYRKEKE